MNPWHLLRGMFQSESHKNGGQETIARLIDLAVPLLQGGNYVEARELLLRALNKKSEIPDSTVLEWILNWLSMTWEQTEDYQEWAAFFTEFIARNPNHASAYHHRAMSLWYGGRLSEAIVDYSRSLDLSPNDVSSLAGRGQVYMECKEFNRAIQDLKIAIGSIDVVPGADAKWKTQSEAYARNGLAAAYAGLGEFDRALEEFAKSTALCPENGWVYYNRAEAYWNLGDQKNATENYKLALTKRDPKLTSLKRFHAESMLNSFKTSG